MSNTVTATPRERISGDTSKAKPAVASDLQMSQAAIEDMTIAWVPVPLTDDLKGLLERVSVSRGLIVKNTNPTAKPEKQGKMERQKVVAILSHLCADAIQANKAAFEKEAEKIPIKTAADYTEEELVKGMEALKKKMEAIQAAINIKKAAPKK